MESCGKYIFSLSNISMEQKKNYKLQNNGQWKVVVNTYFHFLRSQWNKKNILKASKQRTMESCGQYIFSLSKFWIEQRIFLLSALAHYRCGINYTQQTHHELGTSGCWTAPPKESYCSVFCELELREKYPQS